MLNNEWLSSAEMLKPCFSPNDLTVVLTHLWCNDNHNYRGKCGDRQRVSLSLAILIYCFTSARTGELFESTCRRQSKLEDTEADNLKYGAKVMATRYVLMIILY